MEYFIKRYTKGSIQYAARVLQRIKKVGDVSILEKDEFGVNVLHVFKNELNKAGYNIKVVEVPDIGIGIEVYVADKIERKEVDEIWEKVLKKFFEG